MRADGPIDEVPYISTLSHNIGAYVQDDYRISRTFTLNLGVRYDLEVPRTERYNRQNYWDLETPNPIAGGIYRGGLRFAGVNGIRVRPSIPIGATSRPALVSPGI